MRSNAELQGHGSRDRFSQHGETRCAGAADAFRKPLQRAGDRQHGGRHLNTAEGRVRCGDEEVAGERQLEAAAECDTPDDRNRRDA